MAYPNLYFGAEYGFLNGKSITVADTAESYSRTQGTGTSRRVMTFSYWIFVPGTVIANDDLQITGIDSQDACAVVENALECQPWLSDTAGSTWTVSATTNLTKGAWNHVTVQFDTTQVTATNRVKIFKGSVDITNTGSTYPAQNTDLDWGSSGTTERIASRWGGTSTFRVDEIAKIDGSVLPYSSFETAQGFPANLSGLTFGSQGYWIRFETGVASTGGNDYSGNGLNFTNNAYDNADFTNLTPTWPYDAGFANFDGTNDWLTLGAGLTGAADSKLWTFSFWAKRTANTSTRFFASAGSVAGAYDFVSGCYIGFENGASGELRFIGGNAAGTKILELKSANSGVPIGAWHHILVSVDMASTSNRFIYIDDVASTPQVTTYTNDIIDFTRADFGIGADASAAFKQDADIADFWCAPGVYLDLSVTANRRKFIDVNLKPVNLGPDGSWPTGTAPLVFMSGALAAWHTNKGTGGGFTLHGALTASTSGPSG